MLPKLPLGNLGCRPECGNRASPAKWALSLPCGLCSPARTDAPGPLLGIGGGPPLLTRSPSTSPFVLGMLHVHVHSQWGVDP